MPKKKTKRSKNYTKYTAPFSKPIKVSVQPPPDPANPPLQKFEQLALNTLDEVKDTFFTRGRQYADTYETCQWNIMQAVIKHIVPELKDVKLSKAQCIAIGTSSFADMKYERMSGGFKRDHLIDSISYESALLTAVDEARFEKGL